MDLIDKINGIASRIQKLKGQVTTEEATKNAFVMPFITALGYDVFNPLEVIPEYTADIGIKKGEKVDYCILKDEKPAIIIECKHWQTSLKNHDSQLHRYFHASHSRFAILTNGILYRFYSDLESKNKMDEKPFLEINLEKINEGAINDLKRFQKANFDEERIINEAGQLKYLKQVKELISIELKTPSDDFVKFVVQNVYDGRKTAKVFEMFKPLVSRASSLLVSEMINERLQLAIEKDEAVIEEEIVEVTKSDIVTTEEELQGFRIVQGILAEFVEIERVTYRDAKSYFNVLLDDNNRKTICRLWLNRSKKYIGLFDENKKEVKYEISTIQDVFQFKNSIIETLHRLVS